MNKKRIFGACLLFAVALFLLIFELPKRSQKVFFDERGFVFGTIYHINYENPFDFSLQNQVDSVLRCVNNSLSMFNEQSVISQVNRNETDSVDALFVEVFTKAEQVSKLTEGAFDITVAPLVNAWGFGFKKSENLQPTTIDSLLQLVDYKKVTLNNQKISKTDARVELDASAIAKGFGSDMVARFFDSKGIENYMVEIGGEVVVKGTNHKGKVWRIGINKPIDDSTSVQNDIQQVVELSRGGMATSGNYRNFYIKDGKKYAHTIDPKTGYPVEHNLLSATIIADDCTTADALATACMVLGVEKSLQLCETNTIAGFFVFDCDGESQTAYSLEFEKFLAN